MVDVQIQPEAAEQTLLSDLMWFINDHRVSSQITHLTNDERILLTLWHFVLIVRVLSNSTTAVIFGSEDKMFCVSAKLNRIRNHQLRDIMTLFG